MDINTKVRKRIFQGLIITILFFVSSNALYVNAQTITLPTASPLSSGTVISDYAKDVNAGKKEVSTDSQAQNTQKEISNNEKVEAHEEAEAVEPTEKIEPKEAVEPQESVENGGEGDIGNSAKSNTESGAGNSNQPETNGTKTNSENK